MVLRSGFFHGVLEHPSSSRMAGTKSIENDRRMTPGSERTPAWELPVVWLVWLGAFEVVADLMLTCVQLYIRIGGGWSMKAEIEMYKGLRSITRILKVILFVLLF